MREIRLSGSEGGAEQTNAPFLPLSWGRWWSDLPDHLNIKENRRTRYRAPLAKPLDCVQPAAALLPQPAAGERGAGELEGTFLRIVSPALTSPPSTRLRRTDRLADESGSRLRAVQGLRRKTSPCLKLLRVLPPARRGFGALDCSARSIKAPPTTSADYDSSSLNPIRSAATIRP